MMKVFCSEQYKFFCMNVCNKAGGGGVTIIKETTGSKWWKHVSCSRNNALTCWTSEIISATYITVISSCTCWTPGYNVSVQLDVGTTVTTSRKTLWWIHFILFFLLQCFYYKIGKENWKPQKWVTTEGVDHMHLLFVVFCFAFFFGRCMRNFFFFSHPRYQAVVVK